MGPGLRLAQVEFGSHCDPIFHVLGAFQIDIRWETVQALRSRC